MNEFIELITRLISNVGFPIACCIMLYVQQSKSMKELTDAVNNNTDAIRTILTMINKGGTTNE